MKILNYVSWVAFFLALGAVGGLVACGEEKPCLYITTAEWCQPCRQLKAAIARGEFGAFNVQEVPEFEGMTSYPAIRFRANTATGWGVVYGYDAGTAAKITALAASQSADKPEKHVQQVQQVVRSQSLPRVVDTQWGRIDLETYSRPGCNCPMCQGIRALQSQYNQPQYQIVETEVPIQVPERPEQEPTPDDMITQAIEELQLTSSDTLADLGCGDGRVLIQAVRATGCRAIGVEIDPYKARQALDNVERAGLSAQITILKGDAREFDVARNGVTAVFVYLWQDLLRQLQGKLEGVRVVSPYHSIPGLSMEKHGDLWVTE